MSVNRDLELRFQFSPALHQAVAATSTVYLKYDQPIVRNDTQKGALEALGLNLTGALPGTQPLVDRGVWYEVLEPARSLRSINGDVIFRDVLFLSNLIIALEWNPSATTYQQVRLAAKKVSNFLYDVTDGFMAIGQVVIGGPDLMDAADIQIMASNRLHPRAWVDALDKAEKFKPIRIGRGIWQKNRGILSTWDSPEGYRALVHEWGHYAFGLADKYLKAYHWKRDRDDRTARLWDISANGATAVVPEIALSVETVMANNEISEFGPTDKIFEQISARYGGKPADAQEPQLEGPDELPVPLPIFPELLAPGQDDTAQLVIDTNQPEDLILGVKGLIERLNAAGDPIQTNFAESHWVYVLKAPIEDGTPERVIAQGKLSDADIKNGFRLLGAALGDRVAIVSEIAGQVVVHCCTLDAPSSQPDWNDVTPPGLDQPFFVDVIPQPLGGSSQAELYVRVEAVQQPTDVRIYPSGRKSGVAIRWDSIQGVSQPEPVPHLDGHVLLRWRDPDRRYDPLFLCSYSQGGGPTTSAGGRPSISAGSSEGNAMLFFLGPDEAKEIGETVVVPVGETGVRIVTTVLPAHQLSTSQADIESRSYIFSVASNSDLTDYTATLVLYYDRSAPKQRGDLMIRRWDAQNRGWERLTTIAPAELAYVAIPLRHDLETAPSLMDANGPRVERYRIFWERDLASDVQAT
jgi:hypothetical protein